MISQKTLLEMLTYKRPQGSYSQQEFCDRYLQPVFGDPDDHGNYIHIVYNDDDSVPEVCFTSHHDTVHSTGGMQHVIHDPILNFAYKDDKECLGADCTTGIWLMLGMIYADVPGVYVVHAAEEVGCKGSGALVQDHPFWMDHVNFVISFDRYGTKSIITHQMGLRTASQRFSQSLSSILGMDHAADAFGSYTDSNEYSEKVSECTNLSVGYYDQHTSKESQDIGYAVELLEALITADWSKLVADRNPSVVEWDEDRFSDPEPKTVAEVIYDYPDEVAELLSSWGYNAEGLMEDLGYLSNNRWIN